MAKFKFRADITVEGKYINNMQDAFDELFVMINDYDANNPDGADINIKVLDT